MTKKLIPAHSLLAIAITAAFSCFAATSAYAQTVKVDELPKVHKLNLAAAERLLQAAEAKAVAPSAIVIVDTSGAPIAVRRMDGASSSTFSVALGKAQTAAAFGRNSSALEEAANNGRTALISSGYVVMQGGVPITAGADVIGAVGVSGGTKDQDDTAAKAGAAALAQ